MRFLEGAFESFIVGRPPASPARGRLLILAPLSSFSLQTFRSRSMAQPSRTRLHLQDGVLSRFGAQIMIGEGL